MFQTRTSISGTRRQGNEMGTEMSKERLETSENTTVRCFPCASTSESHPAASYCIDCDELLCQTCVAFHKKFKSTKGHTLVLCNKKDRFKDAQLISPYLFCPQHTDKPIEVKCEEHDTLCCLTCATTTHRNCHSICEIRLVAAGCKKHCSVDKLRARIDEVNQCIEEIVTVNDVCRKDLEKSNDEIPKTLKQLKFNLMELFESIEEAVLREVQRLHLDENVASGKREKTWQLKLIATAEHKKMLDTIQEIGSDSHIFVTCHKIKKDLNEIESSLKSQGSQISGKVLNLKFSAKLDQILKTETTESLVYIDSVQKQYQLPKTLEYFGRSLDDSSLALPDTSDEYIDSNSEYSSSTDDSTESTSDIDDVGEKVDTDRVRTALGSKAAESPVCPDFGSVATDYSVFGGGVADYISFSSLAMKVEPGFGRNQVKSKRFSWQDAGQKLFGQEVEPEGGGKGEKEQGDSVMYETKPYFRPIVPLPELVEVKTGEEEEKAIFADRAKLFRFDSETIEWKEKGIGQMKILQHKETGKYRLLFRRERVLTLACNHLLTPDLSVFPMGTSERDWCWTAQDYSEGKLKVEQFAVRIMTSSQGIVFKEKIDEIKALLRADQDTETATTKYTGSNIYRNRIYINWPIWVFVWDVGDIYGFEPHRIVR